MSNVANYKIVDPQVRYKMYWPEGVVLFLSVLTPIIAWLIWRNGSMFGRSGSVMTFFALLAEFISLHRINKKHILNACRVQNGEVPWGFSRASAAIGITSLICALVGTVIWGYGELWF